MIFRFIACGVLVLSTTWGFAQRASIPDSLWCDNLNNIIRCVSMAQIYEPVGKVQDSSYIAPFTPEVRLGKSAMEKIGKEHNKVTYTAYLFSSKQADKKLTDQFENWHRKIKQCLDLWEETRLTNRDKSLGGYQDYFLTNNEDETSVRISIVLDNGYHVRITIY